MSRRPAARPRGTALHQLRQWGHGELDLRVFDEDDGTSCGRVWVDVVGTPHRVVDMPPDYRVNVLDFLDKNADYFHLMTVRRYLIEVMADAAQGAVNPCAVSRLHAVLDVDAATWMANTSVVRALKRGV